MRVHHTEENDGLDTRIWPFSARGDPCYACSHGCQRLAPNRLRHIQRSPSACPVGVRHAPRQAHIALLQRTARANAQGFHTPQARLPDLGCGGERDARFLSLCRFRDVGRAGEASRPWARLHSEIRPRGNARFQSEFLLGNLQTSHILRPSPRAPRRGFRGDASSHGQVVRRAKGRGRGSDQLGSAPSRERQPRRRAECAQRPRSEGLAASRHLLSAGLRVHGLPLASQNMTRPSATPSELSRIQE
mmetsp:Transcript_8098/g.23834  ORF Transcript_8098/g.23834 Transcript_8098/m.23834 type:complete len:246 (+) Transcript_8098:406-1143(+)